MKYKAISKFCNNECNYFVLPAVSKVIYREWFNDGLLKTRLSVHCAPTQRLHFAEGSGWIYIVSMGIVGSINGRKRVDLRLLVQGTICAGALRDETMILRRRPAIGEKISPTSLSKIKNDLSVNIIPTSFNPLGVNILLSIEFFN